MDETYDYVIVGAGSAGCVLAERLSRDARLRILVLEAGGSDRRFFVAMPLGYGKLFYDPAVNWMYRAEPDPGLAGQADHWPRGRIVGGSSAINAMVWIRGHPSDYDDWEAAGNPGQILVGFAAETDNLESYARQKLRQKNLDWIVANSVSAGGAFEAADNTVTLLGKSGAALHFGPAPKLDVARWIIRQTTPSPCES